MCAIALSIVACSNEGEVMPSFSLQSLDGTVLSNKDLEEKIIIIDIWATWCHNCLNELSNMNKLVAKYKDNDEIMFIGLTDESREKVGAFLMKKPFNFTHIPNAKSLTDALQTRMVKTYPQHLVLNKESKIVFQESGEISSVDQVLSQVIEQLR